MELKSQQTALEQIEYFKKNLRSRALSMDYDFMTCEYNYACSMDNLEKMLEKYLERVDGLTKEYELTGEEYLKFRKEAAEILYDAAMKRNEFRMAMFFKKKYGL